MKTERKIMKTQTNKNRTFWCITFLAILFLAGCGAESGNTQEAIEYTEQTAQAIIDGSKSIGTAIYIGLIVNAVLGGLLKS